MNLDYQSYYRRWHDDSPEHLARMIRHFGEKLAPHLPPDRQARVLDVGCGMGFALEALRARGYQNLQGIEIDARQASAAQARNFTVAHVVESNAWLRAHPGSFELILILDVLEHVPREHQFEFLTSLHAALAPSGRLICTVPNANSSLAPRQRYMDWTHQGGFTEHSLEFALHHGGFHEIAIFADDGPRPRLPWLPLWRRRWWYVRGFFRTVRRLQLIAEIGPEEGRRAPLSLNLLGVARK